MMPRDPFASVEAFEEMVGLYREAGVEEFLIDMPRPEQYGGARADRRRGGPEAARRRAS